MHRTTNVAERKFGLYVLVLYIRRGVVGERGESGTAASSGTVQGVAKYVNKKNLRLTNLKKKNTQQILNY
jgi:hypothetical protein